MDLLTKAYLISSGWTVDNVKVNCCDLVITLYEATECTENGG